MALKRRRLRPIASGGYRGGKAPAGAPVIPKPQWAGASVVPKRRRPCHNAAGASLEGVKAPAPTSKSKAAPDTKSPEAPVAPKRRRSPSECAGGFGGLIAAEAETPKWLGPRWSQNSADPHLNARQHRWSQSGGGPRPPERRAPRRSQIGERPHTKATRAAVVLKRRSGRPQ